MSPNPLHLPPLSGTTVLGLWATVGLAADLLLRAFGHETEAVWVLTTVGWMMHPEINRSVPVSDVAPHAPLAIDPQVSARIARPDGTLPGLSAQRDPL